MARFVMKFGGYVGCEYCALRAHLLTVSNRFRKPVMKRCSWCPQWATKQIGSLRWLKQSTSNRLRRGGSWTCCWQRGEQVTIALLAMMLLKKGLAAKSYQGHQVRILTDDAHSRARVLSVETEELERDLSQHIVPVIAGFQGVGAQWMDDDFRSWRLGYHCGGRCRSIECR